MKEVRQTQITYDITFMWFLKKTLYKEIYLHNSNRVTDLENKLTVTRGKGGGRDKLGVWNRHSHTTIDKIDN